MATEQRRERRGFASMAPEKQREIASKGGRAAHEKGTAHEWTADEARSAGRKGGQVSRGGRGRLGDTDRESTGACSYGHSDPGAFRCRLIRVTDVCPAIGRQGATNDGQSRCKSGSGLHTGVDRHRRTRAVRGLRARRRADVFDGSTTAGNPDERLRPATNTFSATRGSGLCRRRRSCRTRSGR